MPKKPIKSHEELCLEFDKNEKLPQLKHLCGFAPQKYNIDGGVRYAWCPDCKIEFTDDIIVDFEEFAADEQFNNHTLYDNYGNVIGERKQGPPSYSPNHWDNK